jgi:hypothetical protein
MIFEGTSNARWIGGLKHGSDTFGGDGETRTLMDKIHTLLNPLDVDLVFQDIYGVDDGLYTFDFHRLWGDFDGDESVGILDWRCWFNPALVRVGAQEGQAGYFIAFDINGDGVISARDYYWWLRGLLGHHLP